MKKHLVVVDLRLIAYDTFHRKESILATFGYIAKMIEHIPNKHVMFAFDSRQGSLRRKELYPEYKNQRRVAEKKQSPAEQKRLNKFNEDYVKLLEILPYFGRVLHQYGVEADDWGNLLAEAFHNKENMQLDMISSDKDWLMNLEIDPTAVMYHNRRGLITLDNLYAEFGLTPKGILQFQALAGVGKENVFGVYKFGEVKFKKLIKEFEGNIDKIIDKVQEWVDISFYGMKMQDGDTRTVREMYDFNYELLRPVVKTDFTEEQYEIFMEQVKSPVKTEGDLTETILELFGKFHRFPISTQKAFGLAV